MIVYKASKDAFIHDVRGNIIVDRILDGFRSRLGYRTSSSEESSWRNSLNFMKNVLEDEGIPNDATVALEYRIPRTSKRIDCIIAGKSASSANEMVIVELKQWSQVKRTSMDGIVETFLGGGLREVEHPSYQAWTYAELIRSYNSAVSDLGVSIHPCAYLHNCVDATGVTHDFYLEYLNRAPLFLAPDVAPLTDFIKSRIQTSDSDDIVECLARGRVRPSMALADEMERLLEGNSAFLMIDDQKVALEKALHLAKVSSPEKKNVLIVDGGPGSGKSVVAINLLARSLRERLNAQYVSKNAAPRAVFQQQLSGSYTKSRLAGLFSGSGQFFSQNPNSYDLLIVDEAHRLNSKSGLYSNLGENQVKELIAASSCTVFMLDEAQTVTLKDIGSQAEIEKWARHHQATVHNLKLQSQFRCNGSDAYLSWLDHVLQVRSISDELVDDLGYDVQAVDSPDELHDRIVSLNAGEHTARTVAGYCWEWKSKKDRNRFDIEIGPSFKKQWNLTDHGSAWIAHPDSIHQIGCIHTCQGLEVDYIGVIIGPDFVVRDGVVVTDPSKRAKADQSLKGRKLLPEVESRLRCDQIIKNTYRTLMSRGSKGCFVYATDPETQAYLKLAMARTLAKVSVN